MIFIKNNATVWKYDSSGYPIHIENDQHAIGSGRDFAITAMHCGKTASEAVQIASLFDVSCGNGVTILTLEN